MVESIFGTCKIDNNMSVKSKIIDLVIKFEELIEIDQDKLVIMEKILVFLEVRDNLRLLVKVEVLQKLENFLKKK